VTGFNQERRRKQYPAPFLHLPSAFLFRENILQPYCSLSWAFSIMAVEAAHGIIEWQYAVIAGGDEADHFFSSLGNYTGFP